MQDRPTAEELVRAAGQFLARELVPVIVDPRLRFRALVAANVLAIVARELQAGEAPLRAEWERLVRLLGKQDAAEPGSTAELVLSLLALNRELCARVRAGEMDDGPRNAAAAEHARQTLVDKLRTSNPRYLERLYGNMSQNLSRESLDNPPNPS